MFSSISPNYEANLKEELFGCFKYIKIPFSELEKMPIRDRKAYIMLHNKAVEKEKEEYEKLSRGNKGGTIEGEAINEYTDRSQSEASRKAGG